jgi:long-chain acyl-CoA synthetase
MLVWSKQNFLTEKAHMILGHLLERNARERSDKTAIVFHDRTVTYRQLNESVNRLANGLLRLGLNKGDRVGLMLPRVPELVIGFLAAAKARGVVVPINFELPAEGIQEVLGRTRPRFVIVAPQFSDHIKACLLPGSGPTVISTGLPSEGWISWNDMMESSAPDDPGLDIHGNDIMYLNLTSGSTRNSKGAVTTHDHIFWNTAASVEALGLTPEDVHLCMFAPFAHPHEILARPLYLGGTMVLLENVYPKSLAHVIEVNRVSCVMGLAPMYENLLDVLDHKAYDMRSLRIPESGGMFTRLDLIERFRRKIGVPIIPVWGSTETTGIALANRPGRDIVPCSAGQPCPSYEVKIVDDDGTELPPGEIGEMIFQGPAVVQQYYDDLESTDSCFRDGWYFSGDLGRMDNHGNFFFIERKCGMMKVAGLKVFPLEIEQVLLDHPSIKEAAVIAAKDRLRGEVPKAIIVPKDGVAVTEKDILQFCRERMAHYKVPRIVEIRASLPKIGSGKVDKKVLQLEEA